MKSYLEIQDMNKICTFSTLLQSHLLTERNSLKTVLATWTPIHVSRENKSLRVRRTIICKIMLIKDGVCKNSLSFENDAHDVTRSLFFSSLWRWNLFQFGLCRSVVESVGEFYCRRSQPVPSLRNGTETIACVHHDFSDVWRERYATRCVDLCKHSDVTVLFLRWSGRKET